MVLFLVLVLASATLNAMVSSLFYYMFLAVCAIYSIGIAATFRMGSRQLADSFARAASAKFAQSKATMATRTLFEEDEGDTVRTTATAESERRTDIEDVQDVPSSENDVQSSTPQRETEPEHSGKSRSAVEQAEEEADAHAKEGLAFERRANFIVSTAKTVAVGVALFLSCTAGCETRPRHRARHSNKARAESA